MNNCHHDKINVLPSDCCERFSLIKNIIMKFLKDTFLNVFLMKTCYSSLEGKIIVKMAYQTFVLTR